MSKRVWIAGALLCLATSCVRRPQPLTLVLTVPPQPVRAPETRPVYVPVPPPVSASATAPKPVPVPLPHTIQNFDLLEIVTGDGSGPVSSDELLRVQGDGTVRLMNVGTVHVSGLDKAGAESAVAEQIRSRQVMAHPVVTVSRKQSATAASAPHGPVAAGDVVHLVVSGLKGPGVISTVDCRVDLAGQIDVPLLGPIKVAGMTDPQAADAIVAALADHQILAKAVLDFTTVEKAPAGIDPLDWPVVPSTGH